MDEIKSIEILSRTILWILRNQETGLKSKDIAVLFVMIGHYNIDDGAMFPKADTVAMLLGYTSLSRRDNIYSSLKKLRKLELLRGELRENGLITYYLGNEFMRCLAEYQKELHDAWEAPGAGNDTPWI